MESVVRIGVNGRISVPSTIREAYGVDEGDFIRIIVQPVDMESVDAD